MCSLDTSTQHHVGMLVNMQKCPGPDPNLLNQTIWGRIQKSPFLANSLEEGLLSCSPAFGAVERMRLEMGS